MYDLSSVADGASTLYVRWGMGPTDGSGSYPGWNLDDIVLCGLVSGASGDYDGDADVDLADFIAFQELFGG